MRTLLIVLVLCSMSILNAQQLNVATYNVRNSNSNDDKEGNGWGTAMSGTYPVNHLP